MLLYFLLSQQYDIVVVVAGGFRNHGTFLIEKRNVIEANDPEMKATEREAVHVVLEPLNENVDKNAKC